MLKWKPIKTAISHAWYRVTHYRELKTQEKFIKLMTNKIGRNLEKELLENDKPIVRIAHSAGWRARDDNRLTGLPKEFVDLRLKEKR